MKPSINGRCADFMMKARAEESMRDSTDLEIG